jgi:pimeloyl-ACP methyl ester carboxylesterase
MASPTPKFRKRPVQPPAQVEIVDPRWLLRAIGITFFAAIFCAYLTFCYLFYQGQWQLILHPVHTAAAPQSIDGAPYEFIHFGPDESATPQLTGWWIPAAPNGRYAHTTLLFLPGSDGSLADSTPTLAVLHNLGINIFAFDYRGYGQSASIRPNQKNMARDTEAAWQYLTTSRDIPAQQLIPYGTGVGASLAAHLAISHSTIPALILDSPHTDLLDVARRDPRSRYIPLSLLFHENFPLAQPLSTLRTPKLLISRTSPPNKAFLTASDPKVTVELTSPSETLYAQSLTRFLDEYIPSAPASQLVPTQTPSAQNPH